MMQRLGTVLLLLSALIIAIGARAFDGRQLGRFLGPAARGGGWLWGKTTEQKKDASIRHGKRSYWWGKEYVKDRAGQSKDTAKSSYNRAKERAEDAARKTDDALKRAEGKVEAKYDSVKSHAKSVADQTKSAGNKAVGKLQAAAREAEHKVEKTARQLRDAAKDTEGRVEGAARDAGRRTSETAQQTEERTKGFVNWLKEKLFGPPEYEIVHYERPLHDSVASDYHVSPSDTLRAKTERAEADSLKALSSLKTRVTRVAEDEYEKTREMFESSKRLIAERPPLPTGEKKASFWERYNKEKAESEQRQRTWPKSWFE